MTLMSNKQIYKDALIQTFAKSLFDPIITNDFALFQQYIVHIIKIVIDWYVVKSKSEARIVFVICITLLVNCMHVCDEFNGMCIMK
jgi:hypothetical protein